MLLFYMNVDRFLKKVHLLTHILVISLPNYATTNLGSRSESSAGTAARPVRTQESSRNHDVLKSLVDQVSSAYKARAISPLSSSILGPGLKIV